MCLIVHIAVGLFAEFGWAVAGSRPNDDPQNGTPALFVFDVLLIASKGTDSRTCSLKADWEELAHRHPL